MEKVRDTDLDFLDLFQYLKKKVWLLGTVFAVCAVLGFLVSALLIAPKYTAATRMYVLNRTTEAAVVYADIQTSTYLLSDYRVLITGQNVTKEVIAKLNLDMKPEELEARIKVTAPENTRVLQISISDTDARRAADIANCVRQVAASQIQEIMDVDAVKLVYEAEVPQEPSSPNVVMNTILAALVGLFAAMGVLSVVYVLDDTIRTEEDVEHYLGLSTMGVIPVADELGSNQEAGRFAKSRK